MKRLILLVLLGFSLLGITAYAQPASGTWVLTTDGTPSLVGNVTGGSVIPSSSTNITGFAGYSFGAAGLTLGATGPTSWPADGSATTANSTFTGLSTGTIRYVQFTISPITGYSLNINSISLPLTENGSATNINAALGYSTDGINFTTFNSNGLTGNALPANILTNFSASPSLTVGSASAVTVRIILWRKAGSTASSSSVSIGTVLLSGTTTLLATPTISPSTNGPLVFTPTTVGSSSASQSFNVLGINLTNNIVITPPAGFEIRTGVNAFSTSPVTLIQSGGSVSSTQIDVRFTPLAAGSYSGIAVQCTSTGAAAQDISVIGGGAYYSKSSGSLDALSTWTTNSTGGAGSAPSNFTTPGQYFYIRNNSTPTLGANWTVTGISSKVIVGDGSNSCVFTIPSSFTYSAQSTEISNQGTLVLQNPSSFLTLGLTVDNGGIYQHDCEGGAQLNGNFLTGSTIKVTGVVASNLWLPQTSYNVIWNCPSQTAAGKFFNLDGTLNINGNLTVLTTGSGYCGVNTGSGTRTLNLGGNLDIQGGSFRLLGASSGTGLTTLNVAGNVTVSDTGTLNISSTSNASPNSPILNVKGNFLHTGGLVTKSSNTSGATIIFNGNTGQQFSTIGLSGKIDFVIDNSSTGVTLNSPATIKGTLTLTNGLINTTGVNLLTLSPTASVSGGSSTSYVNGPLAWTVAGSGSKLFPIGKLSPSNAYRPLTLTVTQNADTNIYSAEQIEGSHSVLGLGGLNSVSSLRYYTISQTGSAIVTAANLQMSYGTDDGVNTNNATLKIAHNGGSGAWVNIGGSGSAPTTGTITSAGHLTTFGDFILAQGSAPLTLNLTALLEGFYDGSTMIADTVTVELHDGSSPYALIESEKGVLNTSGGGSFSFASGNNGVPYYLAIKHRNAVETWSASGQSFSSSSLSYNFTTGSSQAYGDNMVYKGTKWCLYSGDVNQDGIVDSGDLGVVDNDNANYISGYTVTDVNGDDIVDSGDLGIVDNNNSNYVGKITPAAAPAAKKVTRTVKVKPSNN
jgi:hypothetical protein